MPDTFQSIHPVDRRIVDFNEEEVYGQKLFHYSNEERGYADFWLTDRIHSSLQGQTAINGEYLGETVRKGWLLLRSLLWRVAKSGSTARVILASDEQYGSFIEAIEKHGTNRNDLVWSMENLVLDATRTSFEERCIKTLSNLQMVSNRIEIPYLHFPQEKMAFWIGEGVFEDGQAFACDENLACYVYRFLFEEKFLERRTSSDKSKGRHEINSLTPNAIIQLERYQLGEDGNGRQGFLVRKYDPKRDEFFDRVFDLVHKLSGIKVEPVWATEHNEKVDERIFRLIRESSVVVVDVATDRYNVGLEHGFAMGLGKPIVLMKKSNKTKNVLPFDFATQNCAFYGETSDEAMKLAPKLAARMLVAVEKSRLTR